MIEITNSTQFPIFNRHKTPENRDQGLIIHISATKLRLLELADEMGFTKQTKSGMRNFNVGSLDDFLYEGAKDKKI